MTAIFPTLWADLGSDAIHTLENAWSQTATAIVVTFIAHLIIKGLVLRPLDKFAESTANDLDDRLFLLTSYFSNPC